MASASATASTVGLASAARLVARFARLLEQIALDPSVPLHRLDILTADERRRLLHDFNATAAPWPAATLVDLLARQVARTPNAIALVAGDTTLTYAALDARANQLAWRLLADGLGPETRVAIVPGALPRPGRRHPRRAQDRRRLRPAGPRRAPRRASRACWPTPAPGAS